MRAPVLRDVDLELGAGAIVAVEPSRAPTARASRPSCVVLGTLVAVVQAALALAAGEALRRRAG